MKYTPDKEKVENFWREIYEKKMVHNEKVCWIKDQDQSHPTMEWKQVCEKDMAEALRTTLNWKAPGKDQISNFWLKQLTKTHKYMAALFIKLIEEGPIPEWLTSGITFLIPKSENTENLKNYRPVTCLPAIYKFLTYAKILDDKNLLPKEQKGGCSGTKGCKDRLLVSKAILQDCKRRNGMD